MARQKLEPIARYQKDVFVHLASVTEEAAKRLSSRILNEKQIYFQGQWFKHTTIIRK